MENEQHPTTYKHWHLLPLSYFTWKSLMNQIIWFALNLQYKSYTQARENELSDSRERIAIRENELSNSREQIAIREKKLSNSRERITNLWERFTYPWERIAQFHITNHLWLFLKIPMSLQGFRSFISIVQRKFLWVLTMDTYL